MAAAAKHGQLGASCSLSKPGGAGCIQLLLSGAGGGAAWAAGSPLAPPHEALYLALVGRVQGCFQLGLHEPRGMRVGRSSQASPASRGEASPPEPCLAFLSPQPPYCVGLGRPALAAVAAAEFQMRPWLELHVQPSAPGRLALRMRPQASLSSHMLTQPPGSVPSTEPSTCSDAMCLRCPRYVARATTMAALGQVTCLRGHGAVRAARCAADGQHLPVALHNSGREDGSSVSRKGLQAGRDTDQQARCILQHSRC